MQRLNLMTLGAIVIGFCGFIYDASTDHRRAVAERTSYATAQPADASARAPVVLAASIPARTADAVLAR